MNNNEIFDYERNGYVFKAVQMSYEDAVAFLNKYPDFKPIHFGKQVILTNDFPKRFFSDSITDICENCGDSYQILVNSADLDAFYERKIKVQECFPYLRITQRGALFSRICEKCQQAAIKYVDLEEKDIKKGLYF